MNYGNFDSTITKLLGAVCARGVLSHAVLVCGGDAVKRREVALWLANFTVCTGENKPCGACAACRKAQNGMHPDIIPIDKPEKNKQYRKEDVRNLCSDVYKVPNESDIKVYIISEMQNMTVESQNLLLKILEEPPVYTSFILTASTQNVLLPTVMSRVTALNLGEGEGKRERNPKSAEHTRAVAAALTEPGEFGIVSAFAPMEDDKQMLTDCLYELSLVARDAFTVKAGGNKLVSGLDNEARALALSLPQKKLLALFEEINRLLADAEGYQNKALLVTRAASALRRAVQL